LTIPINTTILEAAEKFLNQKVRRFPVLDDGKLVGQISQRDIMRAFEEMNT
jgi:CBS domain-containing protein